MSLGEPREEDTGCDYAVVDSDEISESTDDNLFGYGVSRNGNCKGLSIGGSDCTCPEDSIGITTAMEGYIGRRGAASVGKRADRGRREEDGRVGACQHG